MYEKILITKCLQASGTSSTYHPRANWLGLAAGERITNISAAGIRVSVLTDTGRVATYLDESIGKHTHIISYDLDIIL